MNWNIHVDSIGEDSVSQEKYTEKHDESHYATHSSSSNTRDEDITESEAYIDGYIAAEEEFYTGAEPGTYLPVGGDEDYEAAWEKGYCY